MLWSSAFIYHKMLMMDVHKTYVNGTECKLLHFKYPFPYTLQREHNSFIIRIQLESQSFSDFVEIKNYSKMFPKYESNYMLKCNRN